MEITFLIIFVLCFIFISYRLSNRDVMSPSVLLCLGYFIAIVSCALNTTKWGVNLHINTVVLIVVGILSFVLTEFLINYALNRRKKIYGKESNFDNKLEIINISNFNIILCLFFNLIVFVLLVKDILRISGGEGTLNAMMNTVRTGEENFSSYIIQLKKVSKGIGYLFLFVFVNNYYITRKLKENIKYLLTSITYVIITLFSGGRLNMIAYCVAAVGFFFYYYGISNSWKKKITYKMFIILIIIFLVFLGLFYVTKDVVGRINDRSIFDYMTSYLGGSIQLLDEYMNSNLPVANGIETFPGLVNSFNKLGIVNASASKSLEYRHILVDGMYLGNIYTGLRRYYHDFGYTGVIVIQIIYSTLFNLMYRRVKYGDRHKSINMFIVIYYYYSLFSVLTQAMEDHFFIDFSMGYFVEIIVVYLTIYFIMGKNYFLNNKKKKGAER